jgi:hypothetical protein
MGEFLVVDKAVAFTLALIGGAAGLQILSAVVQAYYSWQQTKEKREQTMLLWGVYYSLKRVEEKLGPK